MGRKEELLFVSCSMSFWAETKRSCDSLRWTRSSLCPLWLSWFSCKIERLNDNQMYIEYFLHSFYFYLRGRAGIFLPFVYYRFICMRYQSRRNPYNRIMFYELRTLVDYYSSQPTCPGFVRNLSQTLINFVQRFAPPQTA